MTHIFICALVNLLLLSFSVNGELDLPIAKIFEVDQKNIIQRQWTKINKDSEAVIENVNSIRLECTASHPIQWIYIGNGIPVLTSNITYVKRQSTGETTTEYTASVLLSPIKEHHTGKYQCSSTESLDFATYFFIYVPGQSLFTSPNSKNIQIPKNDSRCLIPCSVSNPKTTVTLEKSYGDVLQKPRTYSDDAITFDPQQGFHLRLENIEEPEGTYICTARLNNLIRAVEYLVASRFASSSYYRYRPQSDAAYRNNTGTRCNKSCGENAHCELENGKAICKCDDTFKGNANSDGCTLKCAQHTDCPDTMSCYVDHVCRDPCIHSIRCGTEAKCRVEKQRPVCYCPKDFVGDPLKQCFNTIQVDQPQSGDASPKPSFTTPDPNLCEIDVDCHHFQKCQKSASGANQKCVSVCLNHRCGDNAECKGKNHKAICKCKLGFIGDPNKGCGPEKLEEDTEQFDSEFGVEQKLQANKEGSVCSTNQDCPANYVCTSPTKRLNDNTPSSSVLKCAKVCGNRICGMKADCRQVSQEYPAICICPPGHTGDPYRHCEDLTVSKVDQNCTTDRECGASLRCETGRDFRKCTDPCKWRTCSGDMVCQVTEHVASCVCPPGYTGDVNIGCTQDFNVKVNLEPSRLISNPHPCTLLSCGQNSECRVDSKGNATCQCQSGFLGSPPHCKLECDSHDDCPADKTCIRKRCRSVCFGKCGVAAKCRVSSAPEKAPICYCPDGFEGDATKECSPIRKTRSD